MFGGAKQALAIFVSQIAGSESCLIHPDAHTPQCHPFVGEVGILVPMMSETRYQSLPCQSVALLFVHLASTELSHF